MIYCNQVCMYNFPDDGCLKPKDAVCPLSNIARDTNVLTNADHIRSMTDEELAKILLDGCRGSKCEDQPENEWGSVNCFQCRMDWLRQPYKEATDD